MSNTFTMKTGSNNDLPFWFKQWYDSSSLRIDNEIGKWEHQCFNSFKQGTPTATGYNRNSMQPYQQYNSNMPWPWDSIPVVNNVTAFNKYIFDKIRKLNKSLDTELTEYFGDSMFPDTVRTTIKLLPQNLSGVDSQPKNLKVAAQQSIFGNTSHPIYYHDYATYMDYLNVGGASWMNSACALHLIGTPEDVEDLSMFPGLIVREVFDETRLFIKDAVSTSILHAQSQLIKYKLETYYDVVPRWDRTLEDPTAGLFDDRPYCERADFQDPILLETINPSYEQQINPDERVYKIYIQMSDDLIITACERSNFFISIRNSKKKMSIKNFIEYLS